VLRVSEGTRRGSHAVLVAGALTAAVIAGTAAPSSAATGQLGAAPPAAASSVTLRAWGANAEGELGDGVTSNSDVPVKVKLPAGTTITSVRAGCQHTVALTSTGQVLAWGSNDNGQLGNGTAGGGSDGPLRTDLPPGTRITAVRAGCDYTVALTSKGQMLAWGSNDDGQLGIGRTGGHRSVPVQVKLPKGTKVTAISAGFADSVALTSTGQVLNWGDNTLGELGDGTTGGRSNIPIKAMLPSGTSVTAVAAGDGFSVARTSKGQVLAWGSDGTGELGDGVTGGSSDTPVRVMLPPGITVRSLFAGCGHALALTSAGNMLAWGLNSAGQLGQGSLGGAFNTPVTVMLPPGTKVTAISAGCQSSLARTASGHVLAWGFGNQGGLGNGTTVSSGLPVRVQLPAGRSATAIGSGPEAFSSFAITRGA
jgi:alpha-tubulin suppressor-like RCC1 family protein